MSELLFAYSDSDHLDTEYGPKTLILDLDETLIHSWENPNFLDPYEIYLDPQIYRKFHPTGAPQISYSMILDLPGGENRIWGLFRPHLSEFLSFCGDYFDNILVWSAGIQPYVQEIVSQTFLESGLQPPKMVWSRNNCSNYQGYYHKPISELTSDLANRYYPSLDIDLRSTLILDDKVHTFMENPQNGILIPPYYPGRDRPDKIPTMEDLLDRSDNALLQLKDWLNKYEVRNAKDVRVLPKQNIFSS